MPRGSSHEDSCALVGCFFQFFAVLPVTDSTSSAAEIASAVFDAAPRTWKALGFSYFVLATVFRHIYDHSAEREDLDRAIDAMEKAIKWLPSQETGVPDHELAEIYYELGEMLNLRASLFSTHEDYDAAMSTFQAAIQHKGAHSRTHQNARRMLRIIKLVRAVLAGFSDSVPEEELQTTLAQMLRSTDPDERSSSAQALSFFTVAMGARYEKTGNLADLDRSAALATATYLLGGRDPMITMAFATALLARYLRARNHLDLDNALSALRGIDLVAVQDKRLRSQLQEKLAEALEHQMALNGDVTLLEEIMSLRRGSLDLTGREHPNNYAYALSKLANTLFRRSRYNDTLEDLEEALQLFELAAASATDEQLAQMITANQALSLRAKAEMSGNSDDWAKAIDQLRESYRSARDVSAPDRAATIDNFLRSLLRRFQRFGELRDIRECIEVGESAVAEARERNPGGSMSYQLGHQVLWYRVYEDVVDAYLTLAQLDEVCARDATWRALEIAESIKGSIFLNTYRMNQRSPEILAETFRGEDDVPTVVRMLARDAFGLQQTTYNAHSEDESISAADIRSFRKKIGADTAIVSAFSSETQTWWFLITADREVPLVFNTSISRLQWTNILNRMIRELVLSESHVEESWLLGLRELEALSKPLRCAKRLVLSNHQLTCRLPWAVVTRRLHLCGSDGEPIPVLTVPNLKFALLPPSPTRAASMSLVVGDPRGDLEHASEEARAVGSILGVEPLIGAAVTLEAVTDQLEQAGVIHFATHAELANPPRLVRIQLTDGELSVRDILQINSSAKLVVLSACWSGLQHKWGREEFLGLAEAFLVAGALSVVATLWKVGDASALFVVRNLYTNWLHGMPVADALNRALSDASSQQKWEHPHWWGAFFATGRSLSFP